MSNNLNPYAVPFVSKLSTVLVNGVDMICDSLPLNAFEENLHTVHKLSSLKNDHNNCNPNDTAGENEDVFQVLNTMRSGNIDNIVIGILNVNSFRNKHDAMKLMIPGKIDIFIIARK